MKHELEVKLMASLDGELSRAEVAELAALVESDTEARGLFHELQNTRLALQGNESEVRLSESREFYWSKIQREIERLESTPQAEPVRRGLWRFVRRHMATFSGVGVAAALALTAVMRQNPSGTDPFEDVDNPTENSGVFSYRSDEHGATLVWVSAGPETPANDADDESDPDFN